MTRVIMTSTVVILFSALAVSVSVSATAKNYTCGKLAGGARCEDGRCCSSWGYCGSDNDYCGGGGRCNLDCWTDFNERSDHRCGSDVGKPPCGLNRCCSFSGWCGNTADYCAPLNCQYRCWSNFAAALDQKRNATVSPVL